MHHYFVPAIEPTPDANWQDSLKAQRVGVPEQENLAWLAERGGILAPKGRTGSLLLFECNTLHASNKNHVAMDLFFLYNSVDNTLQERFCGHEPRLEFLASREQIAPLDMNDAAFEPLQNDRT